MLNDCLLLNLENEILLYYSRSIMALAIPVGIHTVGYSIFLLFYFAMLTDTVTANFKIEA